MNSKLYIRFSNDIYEDIERGHSFFKGGDKLDGLCAWSTNFDIREGYNEEDVISYAKQIIRNTYGSYSDNSEFHLIKGDYVGSGNDGVLLKNVEVIDSFNI